jgi:hypothetical protein
MMWNWRHRDNPVMQSQYALKQPGLMTVNRTTDEEGMDRIYKLLDLRSLKNPKGQNVRFALQWSPVIVTSVDPTTGHAMVISGHVGGKYVVVNPCGRFANDECSAGESQMPELDIDGKLGDFIWYW